MSLAESVYRLLWHLLLWAAEICDRLLWLRICLQEYVLRGSVLDEAERALLERGKRHLSKLPRHLNVILGRHCASGCRKSEGPLVRLLNYALIMDIECISFFDCRLEPQSAGSGGRRKTSPHRTLRLDKIRCPKQVQSKRIDPFHVTWHLSSNEATKSNGHHRKRQPTSASCLQNNGLGKAKCLQVGMHFTIETNQTNLPLNFPACSLLERSANYTSATVVRCWPRCARISTRREIQPLLAVGYHLQLPRDGRNSSRRSVGSCLGAWAI